MCVLLLSLVTIEDTFFRGADKASESTLLRHKSCTNAQERTMVGPFLYTISPNADTDTDVPAKHAREVTIMPKHQLTPSMLRRQPRFRMLVIFVYRLVRHSFRH